MQEIRCKECGKKLGVISGEGEFLCPRCKTLNKVVTTRYGVLYIDDKMSENEIKVVSAGRIYHFNIEKPN